MRRTLVLLGLALIAAAAPAQAQVRLSIQNGRVSLTATNATLRQILDEWARIGQTRIVNVEKVASAPLNLQLNDVAEEEALDVILRSVSGYVAAPRVVQNPNASRFDRVVIMATSAPVRASSGPAFAQPQAQRREQLEELLGMEPDGTENPLANLLPPGTPRSVFSAPPPVQTSPAEPANRAAGAAPPRPVSVGVSQPGMLVPAPPQPAAAPATAPAVVPNPLGSFLPMQPTGPSPVGVSIPGMIIPVPAQPDAGAESDTQAR
jgi:hypothetical protein